MEKKAEVKPVEGKRHKSHHGSKKMAIKKIKIINIKNEPKMTIQDEEPEIVLLSPDKCNAENNVETQSSTSQWEQEKTKPETEDTYRLAESESYNDLIINESDDSCQVGSSMPTLVEMSDDSLSVTAVPSKHSKSPQEHKTPEADCNPDKPGDINADNVVENPENSDTVTIYGGLPLISCVIKNNSIVDSNSDSDGEIEKDCDGSSGGTYSKPEENTYGIKISAYDYVNGECLYGYFISERREPTDECLNFIDFTSYLERRNSDTLERVNAFDASLEDSYQEIEENSVLGKVCSSNPVKRCRSLPTCISQHGLPTNFIDILSANQLWIIMSTIKKASIEPNEAFLLSVINWVDNNDVVAKVLWISKYLVNGKNLNSQAVWDCIIQALVSSGLKKWFAVFTVLHFFHDERIPQSTRKLIYNMQIEESYPHYWRTFQLLAENQVILPKNILLTILKDICCQEIRGHQKFLKNIWIQVSQIKDKELAPIKHLIQTFSVKYKWALTEKDDETFNGDSANKSLFDEMHLGNMNHEPPHYKTSKKVRFESDYSKHCEYSSELYNLRRALQNDKYSTIACILVVSSHNRQMSNIIVKEIVSYYLANNDNLLNMAKYVMLHIYKSSEIYNRKNNMHLMARLCIDLIISLANRADWENAYQLITVIRENHINPVTLQPVCTNVSCVRVALILSNVLLNSGHFNSAISILISNNLILSDSSKWLIKGNSLEFNLVKDSVNNLLERFFQEDVFNAALRLFNAVLKAQRTLQSPINISGYYEPLLLLMIEYSMQSQDEAIKLYLRMNDLDNIQLSGLTIRALIVIAMRKHKFLLLNDLINHAIWVRAYPTRETMESTILLGTCYLKEEMFGYILDWCKWYVENENQRSNREHGNQRRIHIEFKELNNENFRSKIDERIPSILESADPSFDESLNRLMSVISEIMKIYGSDIKIVSKNVHNNTLHLSRKSSEKLLTSAIQMFKELDISQNLLG